MDVLDSSYFMYSNKFLSIFGLWPYQDIKMRYTFRMTTVLLLSSLLIPTMCKVVEQWHNFGYILLGVPSLLYYVEILAKYMYLAVKRNEIKRILDHIQMDFQLQASKKLEILREYAEEARGFNNIYAIYLSTVVIVYSISVWMPQILDIVVPLNESRPKPIPRLMRYYVDSIDDNFHFIVLHGMIIDSFGMLFFVGFDTLLINCTQHACALFKIVIDEVEGCLKASRSIEADNKEVLKLHQDKSYNEIVKAIDMHKHALEFIAMVDSMYSHVNLFVIGISLLTISLTEFETVVHLKNTGLMIRFLFFTIGELVHILYYNWPGQRVQDHSLLVYQSCYNCEWYREDISDNCKKLLKLMMARSQASSYLTAGKVYVLSYANFAKILKASLSFFTVLLSAQ